MDVVNAAQGTPRTPPDWGEIHRELRLKGVTLTPLRLEDEAAHPVRCGTAGFFALGSVSV